MRTKKNNVLFTVLRALYWVQLLLGLTTVCLFVSLAYIIIFLCAHRVTQPKNTLIIYQATREWLAMSVSVSCVEGKLPRFFAESSCHGAKYLYCQTAPPPLPHRHPQSSAPMYRTARVQRSRVRFRLIVRWCTPCVHI